MPEMKWTARKWDIPTGRVTKLVCRPYTLLQLPSGEWTATHHLGLIPTQQYLWLADAKRSCESAETEFLTAKLTRRLLGGGGLYQ